MMASEEKRHNLGRGLSALLGDNGEDLAAADDERTSRMVPIEFVQPGRYQPRRSINDDQINDLAQSIREKGILQPILVRRHPDEVNTFEIIAGERRWRAAQLAQLHEVPVVIKDLDDRETLEIALIENLQRQDLSALEEAEGYRRLMDEFTHGQEELAKTVGKSRSHVANMMRLLGLPDPIKNLLEDGSLSVGHARALLNADDGETLASQVVKRGLNVRQTEKLVRKQTRPPKPRAQTPEKDADTLALERDLSALLGLTAEIQIRGAGGALTLHYNSLEQLDDVLNRLSQPAPALLPDGLDDDIDPLIDSRDDPFGEPLPLVPPEEPDDLLMKDVAADESTGEPAEPMDPSDGPDVANDIWQIENELDNQSTLSDSDQIPEEQNTE